MNDKEKMAIGTIGWRDLTIDDAGAVRDFYKSVVGWESRDLDMGGYSDYTMTSPDTGEEIAGVCHAQGGNAGLPAQWLIYIVVADIEQSAAKCRELGGEILVEPKQMGSSRYCVIRDPAGAVCALYQP